MADPLSIAGAIIGLIPITFQAVQTLHNTIQSFKKHPKQVRGLIDELEDLINVLKELESILRTPGSVDLNLLEAPLKRCESACKEFAQALQECRGRRDGGTRSDFSGWLKIRWRGSDINELRDILASYKSTMAIAVSGANLRTTKVSLDVIKEYQKMIGETKADLNERISNINDKMSRNLPSDLSPESPVDRQDMEAEKYCTIQCLQICAQMTTFIEEKQRMLLTYGQASEKDRNPDVVHISSSQRVTGETLQDCKLSVKAQQAQLSNRLQYLNTRLNNISESQTQSAEQGEMLKEVETIHQCLDILDQNARNADKANVNVVEDVTSADDSNQVIVSTIGELISAHRITAGMRSNMTIGQMSDETVQHVSTAHANRLVDIARLQLESRTGRDSVNSTGRVLGQSNVRTL